MDLYSGYNLQKSANDNSPHFMNMNRHNEPNFNLAYLDIRFQTVRVRSRFDNGCSEYMNAYYYGEQGYIRNLVEASVGFKPFAKKRLRPDAGLLGLSYSNESGVSKDHRMQTSS
jgi:hypothetical protein